MIRFYLCFKFHVEIASYCIEWVMKQGWWMSDEARVMNEWWDKGDEGGWWMDDEASVMKRGGWMVMKGVGWIGSEGSRMNGQ